MKTSKTKSDSTYSKKDIKRKIKKDLRRAIFQKLAESMKSFGLVGNKIEKNLNKASKRLAKKLAGEFKLKDISKDIEQLKAKSAISAIRKPKQTSLAEAKKVVAKALKTNNAPKAGIPIKKVIQPTRKKVVTSPTKSASSTSTTKSDDHTALTTKPVLEKSDVSDV